MAREGILCAGNWVVDRVKMIDRFPTEETLANILSESRQNGGAAFNVLIDLAKLGAEFPLVGLGCIGDDADGRFVREVCEQHSIDSTRLILEAERTSYTDVMTVADTGKRTFFHHRGANASLGPEHFDFNGIHCRHLHLGYLLLLDRMDEPDPEFGTVAARVLADARAHGMSTSVDLVSSRSARTVEVVRHALRQVDLCFMNELELSSLVGDPVAEDEPIDSLRGLTDQIFDEGFAGTLIVHSAKFAFLRSAHGIEQMRPSAEVPVNLVRGTVGAGDAFAAGFLMAFLGGQEPRICLQWGVAAGASCLLGEGASNGVLPMAQALSLLASHHVGPDIAQ